MLPKQLKETAMDQKSRKLIRIHIENEEKNIVRNAIEKLMGNKAEERFKFIQNKAPNIDQNLINI